MVQSLAMEGPALPKREAGPIGGTAADLRRLSMDQAFDLLKRLGMPPEDIERTPPFRAGRDTALSRNTLAHACTHVPHARTDAIRVILQKMLSTVDIRLKRADIIAVRVHSLPHRSTFFYFLSIPVFFFTFSSLFFFIFLSFARKFFFCLLACSLVRLPVGAP